METEVDLVKRFTDISLSQLKEVVSEVYELSGSYRVWLFDAPMGSGKTTFIKYLCENLKVEDHVSSPTFSIVNEYESPKVGIIYHFDFYRIEKEQEVMDIGLDEYLYSGNLCLLEWPELIPSFIPDSYLLIQISPGSQADRRDILISKYGKGNIS